MRDKILKQFDELKQIMPCGNINKMPNPTQEELNAMKAGYDQALELCREIVIHCMPEEADEG